MNFNNKILQNVLIVALAFFTITGCQKLSRPALGDYPVDANPPGGPLKFYAAMDGSSVDSVLANYGSDNAVTYGEGIHLQAFNGNADSYVQYGKANDFGNSTSFTVAFWLKKTPQPAGAGTNFAFALNSKGYSWTNLELFLEFEDAGNPSTMDSAAAKFYLLDQWFEFTGNKRMPKVLDGQWHQLVFTYDATSSVLTTYIDGAPMAGLPAGFGNVTNNGGPRGALSFTGLTGFTIGGPGKVAHDGNDWMNNFNGGLDQFRLYDVAMSPADVTALYTSKL